MASDIRSKGWKMLRQVNVYRKPVRRTIKRAVPPMEVHRSRRFKLS
jgi:hypothetical protein